MYCSAGDDLYHLFLQIMSSHAEQMDQSSNNGGLNGQMSNGNGQLNADATPIPPQPPLSDFLMQLEEYTPTIPDAVVKHYLSTSGFDTSDPRVLRLVSLAAQKFVSDVANDALQHCKMRSAGQAIKNNKNKDRKFVMTMEDLGQALGNQGVTVKKPPYYT